MIAGYTVLIGMEIWVKRKITASQFVPDYIIRTASLATLFIISAVICPIIRFFWRLITVSIEFFTYSAMSFARKAFDQVKNALVHQKKNIEMALAVVKEQRQGQLLRIILLISNNFEKLLDLKIRNYLRRILTLLTNMLLNSCNESCN